MVSAKSKAAGSVWNPSGVPTEREHSLRAGQDCAVMFEHEDGTPFVCFGQVLRIVACAKNGRAEFECRTAVALNDRVANVKVYCLWYEEISERDLDFTEDLKKQLYESPVEMPAFKLGITDRVPGRSRRRLVSLSYYDRGM
jgi:hypothetical protein